jgi:hypothetical protein
LFHVVFPTSRFALDLLMSVACFRRTRRDVPQRKKAATARRRFWKRGLPKARLLPDFTVQFLTPPFAIRQLESAMIVYLAEHLAAKGHR